jgi:hypothetical protein
LTIEQLKADVYGKHWEDQSWHEVLWLICGMVDERWAGEIIGYLANVLSRPWPEYFGSRPPRNIELAIYCMGEARNLSSLSVASESLLNLVCQLFDHAFNAGKETMSFGDYMRQQFILPMKSVGTRWPQRIVLVRWLKGLKQTQYARFYAEAFGAFVGIVGAGLESIYQVLLDYYKSDVSDFRILSLWALALGWKQEKETLSCLRDCVVNDANSDVREEALLALTKTFQQDLQILQLVRDRTVNDMDQEVRSTAIRTLAAYFYDDIQTLPLICDRAVNDASSNVRSSAVRVLAQRFGDKPQTLDFWSG